jgi:hypothetical protein
MDNVTEKATILGSAHQLFAVGHYGDIRNRVPH